MPTVNMMGAGCLSDAVAAIAAQGFSRGLIVTDKVLDDLGMSKQVADLLDEVGVSTVIFNGAQPNPTIGNVNDGWLILDNNGCDFIISLGGGSPHDCAKGIALVATNGGCISSYEGVDKSTKPMMPLIAINTTAGTASEMTRFCIITDEVRHIKMAIVDKHTTPLISVNDPEMMVGMPKGLTAATGMDALTHAIEAYLSTAATPITDAVALKAITMIFDNLKTAVHDGSDMEARENMAYAQFMAGMAFNNASLGYVHAMAHQLGGMYNLPHGVCNAVLLPHVVNYNASACPERILAILNATGHVGVCSSDVAKQALIDAINVLSNSVGIPTGIAELGAKEEDIPTLATNALNDACGFTNPRKATHEEICSIYKAAM